jgi:hypothetical protein
MGNLRGDFRFDQRFRALFGGTRQQVANQIDSGITRLPGNCYFRLDKESRKLVLENLRARLQASRVRMVAELRALAAQFGRRPTLLEYLSETGYDLADVYKPSIGGWHALLSETEFLSKRPTESDVFLSKRFQLMLHLDSTRRLSLYRDLLVATAPSLDALSPLEKRMVQMLTFRLLHTEARQPECQWETGLTRLRENASAGSEFQELCDALFDGIKLHANEHTAIDGCPLFLHRQYMRDEVLVGLGLPELVGARHPRQVVSGLKRSIPKSSS